MQREDQTNHAPWLGLATFSTLFCCGPLGWVALAFSLEAERQRVVHGGTASSWTTRGAAITSLAALGLGALQWIAVAVYTLGPRFVP